MFAIALALFVAIVFIDAAHVQSIKACSDPICLQGNSTLHENEITSSESVFLEKPRADAPSPLDLDDFRIQCPSGDHIGALVPIEGASPKQYTLQFVADDAQLPEGAIYYIKCVGRQPDAMRT